MGTVWGAIAVIEGAHGIVKQRFLLFIQALAGAISVQYANSFDLAVTLSSSPFRRRFKLPLETKDYIGRIPFSV